MHRPLNPSDLILNVSPLPPIKLADTLLDHAPSLPPEIIHGVLHQGSKMIMGGTSKGRKSWMLMDLAVCVSEGLEWWGFTTEKKKTPTLYLNFEIQEAHFTKRLAWIAEVRKLKALPNLKLWNLRGFAAGLDTLRPLISDQLANHHVGLLILDPLYKMLGTTDENANTDMAQMMNEIEKLAVQHGCAVVFAHHFRKGGPGDAPSMDRMSGAGVLARDPDSIIVMQDHENEDCVVVEPTLRNFPPQKPFGLHWECPIFTRDPDLDTSKIKGKAGAKALVDPNDLKGWMKKKEWGYSEMVDEIVERYGVSESTSKTVVRKAIRGKIIEKGEGSKKYSLTI